MEGKSPRFWNWIQSLVTEIRTFKQPPLPSFRPMLFLYDLDIILENQISRRVDTQEPLPVRRFSEEVDTVRPHGVAIVRRRVRLGFLVDCVIYLWVRGCP